MTGNFYIKLVVSGGTPAFDSTKTELEYREYLEISPIKPPDIVETIEIPNIDQLKVIDISELEFEVIQLEEGN